ncbi:hypothetical protein Tsubulata_011093 [Turnera subulata]|uniref:RRM domain-containing protein n=1 Tax=Turnera subulata TaxID=218843 RepID=A0A9Q0F9N0_9ROSI|nr:hypothetical protein Tsubulata_011093 [Turnera subulata]
MHRFLAQSNIRQSILCSPISPGLPSQRPSQPPLPLNLPTSHPPPPPPPAHFPLPLPTGHPTAFGHAQPTSPAPNPALHLQNQLHTSHCAQFPCPILPSTSSFTNLPPAPPQQPIPQAQRTADLPSQPAAAKQQHFSKWSRKKIQSVIENNQAVSIYVANLPSRWLPTDVHLMLSRFGEVMDFFIPKKLNKRGSRFVFVQFQNNIDIQNLISKISTVKVDDNLLIASLARERRVGIGSSHINNQAPKALTPREQGFRDNRSFADTVRGSVSHVPTTNPTGLQNQTFIPKDPTLSWLQCSAVGVLQYPMTLSHVKERFADSGLENFDIIPLGVPRKTVLGHPTDSAGFLLEESPHVWTREFFQLLTSMFGTMVDWSSESRERRRFDVTEVLILTSSMKFIDSVINIDIEEHPYEIGIAESQYDPCDWDWS